jgi:hypothetical protein
VKSGRIAISSTRSALTALLLIAPAPSIGALVVFWIAPGTTLGSVAYGLGKAALYVLPVTWLLLVERGRIAVSRPSVRSLIIGAATGVVIGAGILALHWFIADRIDADALKAMLARNRLLDPRLYWALAAWLSLVNALLEEYAFRWFITGQCRRLMPLIPALIVSALIFMAHHVIVIRAYLPWGHTALASAGVFVGGLIWSGLCLKYRSIWPGYVSHVLVDVAILIVGWRIAAGS